MFIHPAADSLEIFEYKSRAGFVAFKNGRVVQTELPIHDIQKIVNGVSSEVSIKSSSKSLSMKKFLSLLTGKQYKKNIFQIENLGYTKFMQSVFNEVSKIKYGSTKTYGDIAGLIGQPNACRAVGNALNKNLTPILVPCHRVVLKNGIGGFRYGEKWKRLLLMIESNTDKTLKS